MTGETLLIKNWTERKSESHHFTNQEACESFIALIISAFMIFNACIFLLYIRIGKTAILQSLQSCLIGTNSSKLSNLFLYNLIQYIILSSQYANTLFVKRSLAFVLPKLQLAHSLSESIKSHYESVFYTKIFFSPSFRVYLESVYS